MPIVGVAPTVLAVVSWARYVATANWAFGLLWLLGLLLFGVCLAIGIQPSFFDTKWGRAGVLTGIGMSVIALGTTFFAMAAAPKATGP